MVMESPGGASAEEVNLPANYDATLESLRLLKLSPSSAYKTAMLLLNDIITRAKPKSLESGYADWSDEALKKLQKEVIEERRDINFPDTDPVAEGKQNALRLLVEQEIKEAQTIEDLAEAKRKSLSLQEDWRIEAGEDIKKRLSELLTRITQKLLRERGFYEE